MTSEIKTIVDRGLGGFKVLPIKFSDEYGSHHYLYYREHAVKNFSEDRPSGRTLFCVNVPPYTNQRSMAQLFKDCGKVEKVIFKKNPSDPEEELDSSKHFASPKPVKGFKMAYIVFKSKEGVKTALDLKEYSPRLLTSAHNRVLVGIEKWMSEYNSSIPKTDILKKEIDEYMEEYDQKVEAENERLKKVATEPDEEGWTTVTSKGRRPGVKQPQEKKKRSKKQLINFYTFQIRESKMKRVEELRQKFDQDKSRIQKMKELRKFKPY